MTVDFPAGTRWLQMKGRAVAITPDERVYLVRNGRAVELLPPANQLAATDELAEGVGRMVVGELTEDFD